MKHWDVQFRLHKWLERNIRIKPESKIPANIVQMFRRHGYDLERNRFYGKQLTVQEVDCVVNMQLRWEPMLDRDSELLHRARMGMVIKNQLFEHGLMEGGYIRRDIPRPVLVELKNALMSKLRYWWHYWLPKKLPLFYKGFAQKPKTSWPMTGIWYFQNWTDWTKESLHTFHLFGFYHFGGGRGADNTTTIGVILFNFGVEYTWERKS